MEESLGFGVEAQPSVARVLEVWRALELPVRWPNLMTDVSNMLWKWLESSRSSSVGPYHRREIGMEHSLKSKMQHDSYGVTYTPQFTLPFAELSHVFKRCFGLANVDS